MIKVYIPYTLKLSQNKLSQNKLSEQTLKKNFTKTKQENIKTRSSKIHIKIRLN
jgi:hypothetical protein